jgi:hypothetical protein
MASPTVECQTLPVRMAVTRVAEFQDLLAREVVTRVVVCPDHLLL